MEENHVYELFEDLLQQLLVAKPDKPLDFLIEQLDKKPVRRVFLMGPPGTFRTECAKAIGEETGWQPIQTGYLLKEEESKKTVLGAKINEAKKAYHYIDDEVIIEVVKK